MYHKWHLSMGNYCNLKQDCWFTWTSTEIIVLPGRFFPNWDSNGVLWTLVSEVESIILKSDGFFFIAKKWTVKIEFHQRIPLEASNISIKSINPQRPTLAFDYSLLELSSTLSFVPLHHSSFPPYLMICLFFF